MHDLWCILVTDYGAENPLLMDYFGFQPALYKLKFKSRGDSGLSQRVVELYKQVDLIVSIGMTATLKGVNHRLDKVREQAQRLKAVAKMGVVSKGQD